MPHGHLHSLLATLEGWHVLNMTCWVDGAKMAMVWHVN
jgi:hypothetical protein